MEENYLISDEVKAATTNCQKSFSCLSAIRKASGMCKVVFCVNCKMLGILCESEKECTYKYDSEDRTYCICPTRKEIYMKYKV